MPRYTRYETKVTITKPDDLESHAVLGGENTQLNANTECVWNPLNENSPTFDCVHRHIK